MAEFVAVASTPEVPPGRSKVVVAAGQIIALFNVDGRFYAMSGTCLHRGGPVGEGELDGPIVTCPWHGWQYDVRTGQNVLNPMARLTSYTVKVENGAVFVAPT